MKTKIYLFITMLIISANFSLFGQGGMTIRSGGKLTVGGNLSVYECLPSPGISTSGNIPSQYQIVWNWDAVAGAIGYRWNTINDYNTAIDMGTSLTKTEIGLACNTVYTRYVWAYKDCGSSTPLVLTQLTLLDPPATPTSGTHVPSFGQIIWNWNSVVGAAGYKWNTINDYNTATGMGLLTSKTETDLYCNTSYTRYVWAYSACGLSTAVTMNQTTSACPPFSCGQPVTDTRDGKIYNTVLIGTQCWMAQNLNVGTKISLSSSQTNNGIIEKYCYGEDENMCNVYGGLYQWDEAMQYSTTEGVKGICPTDWHLPTDAEWTTLTTFLDGDAVAGGKMKEIGTAHWASPNTGATNTSGFTALPGGSSHGFAGYFYFPNRAAFWSSSKYDITYVRALDLHNSVEYVNRFNNLKTSGFSTRCLKD